ncbi:hypothetical protein PPERSA_03887 [Pseudocohnilembus persalinus]|uniref:C2HC/C3H-type domain-containing protein n=1 Tax=Pseudocohnilembus persalinus TaxID=266149 RepID=A0A0V0Q944_PSEPJ|nr:hypothetical protein PPERSA_03887 [Pseudocohnilembus persalinus]|eukprot:KRW98752.1 hypothetical protein PPERSA_03887 [Pseudocohnilembus persalinus]
MSSDIPILSNTNSRIGRGVNQRRNLGKTGENVLGGTGAFQPSTNINNNVKEFGTMDLNSTQSSNGYVPRQRGNLANSNQNNLNQNSYNPTNNFGMNRKPLISEQQIDQHTQKIEKEIQNLDFQLKENKNNNQNNYSTKNFNTNNFKKTQDVFNLDNDTQNNNNNYGNYGNYGYSTQTFNAQNNQNSQNNNNNFGFQSHNNQPRYQQNELSNGFSNYGKDTTKNDTGISFNPASSRNNFNSTFNKQKNLEKKQGTELVLDIFEQKEKELKEQLKQIENQKQQQEKVMEIKEKANQQSKLKMEMKKNQEGDLKLKLSSPIPTSKKNGGSIIENQKRQLSQQQSLNKRLDQNQGSSSFKPNFTGLNSNNKNNNNKINNNINYQDVLEDSSDYMPGGYVLSKTQNQQQQQGNKKQVKDIDNEIAVATGVNEALFEESQQLEEVQLITCPEGCGRQFTEKALEKHVGVCKKLFQKKNVYQNKNNSKNDKNKNNTSNNNLNKNKKAVAGKQGPGGNLQEFKKKMKQQKMEQQQNGELDMKFV